METNAYAKDWAGMVLPEVYATYTVDGVTKTARQSVRLLSVGRYTYDHLAPVYPEQWTAAEVDEYEAALAAARVVPVRGAFEKARAQREERINGDHSWLLARAITAPEPLREYPRQTLAEIACGRMPQAPLLQDRMASLLDALKAEAAAGGKALSMRELDALAQRFNRLAASVRGRMSWMEHLWGRDNRLKLLHGLTLEIRPEKRVAVILGADELVEVPATAAALRLLHKLVFAWRHYLRLCLASNLRYVLLGRSLKPGDVVRLGLPVGDGMAIVGVPGMSLHPEVQATIVGSEPLAWKHWGELWALAHTILQQHAGNPKVDRWLRSPTWPRNSDPFARLLPEPRSVAELLATISEQGRERITALAADGSVVELGSPAAVSYRTAVGAKGRLVLDFKSLALAVDFEASNRHEYF